MSARAPLPHLDTMTPHRLREISELIPSYVQVPQAIALHDLTRNRDLGVVREREPVDAFSESRASTPRPVSALLSPLDLVLDQHDHLHRQRMNVLVAQIERRPGRALQLPGPHGRKFGLALRICIELFLGISDQLADGH